MPMSRCLCPRSCRCVIRQTKKQHIISSFRIDGSFLSFVAPAAGQLSFFAGRVVTEVRCNIYCDWLLGYCYFYPILRCCNRNATWLATVASSMRTYPSAQKPALLHPHYLFEGSLWVHLLDESSNIQMAVTRFKCNGCFSALRLKESKAGQIRHLKERT